MKRRGIGRIELAICLIVAVLLVLLLVPAIQKVRHAQARTETNDHLKLCAAAIHSFHEANRRFPDAFAASGALVEAPRCLWFQMLPHLNAEDAYRHNRIDAVVPAYIAPLDPYGDDTAGALSFAANLRLFGYKTFTQAACDQVGAPLTLPPTGTEIRTDLTLSRIVDGAHDVLMLATRYRNCSGTHTGYGADPAAHGGFFGAGSHERLPGIASSGNDLTFQIKPSFVHCNPAPGIYGHSFETSGMSVAMADGAVRNMTPKVSPIVFGRLLSPGDGHLVRMPEE